MKHSLWSGLVLCTLVLAGCRESNDLLSKIFTRSFKSKTPMVNQTDNIWQPLVGYYLLENERIVRISKKDAKTYKVDFYPSSIGGSEMNNTATTCMAGKTRFFNLLSYQNNFLFFTVKSINDSTYSLDFVSSSVRRMISDTATGPDFRKWWIKNEASFENTDALFDSYKLEKYSEKEALAYHKRQIRESVYNMSDFEKYKLLYPEDADLENFRVSILKKSIERCSDVASVKSLIQKYPEVTEAGKAKAKTFCTSTLPCLKYIDAFPSDTANERIKSIAFNSASTSEEIEKLILAFPTDKRSNDFRVKLLLSKTEECTNDEDYNKLMEKYSADEKALRIINTVKVFNQITPNGTPFNKGSHVLSADGKKALDKISDFLVMANQDETILTNVYFAVSSADGTDSLPQEISYVVSMNRCVAMKKYLTAKKIKGTTFHFIPVGNGLKASSLMNPQFSFSSFEKRLKNHKDAYKKWCFSSGQTIIVPDANYEFKADNWINEDSYVQYVKQQTQAYFAAYKKGAPVEPKVPVHLWNEELATDKTLVQKFKEELKPLAKQVGISKKTFPQLGFTAQ